MELNSIQPSRNQNEIEIVKKAIELSSHKGQDASSDTVMYQIFNNCIDKDFFLNNLTSQQKEDLINHFIETKKETNAARLQKNFLFLFISELFSSTVYKSSGKQSIETLEELIEKMLHYDPSLAKKIYTNNTSSVDLEKIISKNRRVIHYLDRKINNTYNAETKKNDRKSNDLDPKNKRLLTIASPDKFPRVYAILMGLKYSRLTLENALISSGDEKTLSSEKYINMLIEHDYELKNFKSYEKIDLKTNVAMTLKLPEYKEGKNSEIMKAFYLQEMFVMDPGLIKGFINEISNPKTRKKILENVSKYNPEGLLKAINNKEFDMTHISPSIYYNLQLIHLKNLAKTLDKNDYRWSTLLYLHMPIVVNNKLFPKERIKEFEEELKTFEKTLPKEEPLNESNSIKV